MVDLSTPYTQPALAMLVGVTQQAISAWVTDGKLPPTGALGDLLVMYCSRLRDQAAGRLGAEAGGLDLVQERAALAREQRLGIEIKNAVARGEYASISLLAEVLATASQAVSERFEQLPGLMRKVCPELPDAARDKLMSAIADARNQWVRATSRLVSEAIVEPEDEPEGEGEPL